jgi:protein arginine kinase
MMSLEELLDNTIVPWMKGNGEDSDVVLASRIRLARNLKGIPFPHVAGPEQLELIKERIKSSLVDFNEQNQLEYTFIDMEKLPVTERFLLVERHVISPQHAKAAEGRGLLVRKDAAVSILVNEEDHLRIQCLLPGLNLQETFELASNADDVIENRHDIAFDEQLGYLTSCPTNLGTGLRASVMVHLPALVLAKQISRIINAVTQLGLAVRGLYGEGTEAVGNIYQISNQLTLGFTEKEITDTLYSVAKQVIEHERSARKGLVQEANTALADRIWRSYGILNYARTVSGQEALAMLSEVRLGMDLGIITNIPAVRFNELLVATSPSFLQKFAGRSNLSQAERRELRAQIIREKIGQEG